jgi:hypothetical protein
VPGATTKSTVRSAGGHYDFHTGGTAADIYLKDASPAPAVAAAMAQVPGVAAAYFQVPGTYQYELATGVKPPPGLDAAYRYLLGTFSCPQAPAVVAHFRENTIGSAYSSAHGDHGGANWGAQAVPLIFSGPGVPRNTVSHHPARLMDVAPTVLRLLGLPAVTMDGAVLADALVTPAPSEIALQAQIGTNLTAYQDALMAQSTANIAEDQKTGHHPPPPKPARP